MIDRERILEANDAKPAKVQKRLANLIVRLPIEIAEARKALERGNPVEFRNSLHSMRNILMFAGVVGPMFDVTNKLKIECEAAILHRMGVDVFAMKSRLDHVERLLNELTPQAVSLASEFVD